MTMPATEAASSTLTVGTGTDAREIAVLYRAARTGTSGPMLVWLGGYRSDMAGTKAIELDAYAATRGLACLRLDYSGHGRSGGAFADGTISRWLEESLAVIAAHPAKELILIGSSMVGG